MNVCAKKNAACINACTYVYVHTSSVLLGIASIAWNLLPGIGVQRGDGRDHNGAMVLLPLHLLHERHLPSYDAAISAISNKASLPSLNKLGIGS